MSKLITNLFLTACFLFTISTVNAEIDSSSQTIIEMADVTIRMTNSHPYAEFRPCEGCPSRLLSFSPTAQIYLRGQRTTASELQDGQTFTGTIFIQSSPIESIREIVAK